MRFSSGTYLEAGMVGILITAAIYVGIDHANITEAQGELVKVNAVLDRRGDMITDIRERLARIETLLQEIKRGQ